MGELKPIGSEKLKGDAKIQRILDLTYYQSNDVLKESKSSVEVVKEGRTGIYGIEKEKDGYYVKKGLNENSLDYIGGMFMKNKNRFSSYNEALKKMEFLVEQENMGKTVLTEATKYVLKQNKPAPIEAAPLASEAPIDAAPLEPAAPEGDVGPLPGDEMGDESVEDPNDYMKVLQKLAGKLQEKINKYEDRLESSDYKAVIKQILSAVDLNKLEEVDKDDILSMFEDEVDPNMAEPTGDFPTDGQGEVPAPQETAEMDGMSLDGVASLDELINTPLDDFGDEDTHWDFGSDEDEDEDNFGDVDFLNDPEIEKAGKFAKKDSEVEEGLPIQGMGEEDDDVRELDLDELTNMVNSTVKETLGKYFE